MTRRELITLNIEPTTKDRVVIIGSGFAGMSFAKALRKHSSDTQIVMLEKRDFFMSCPLSNAYLGGLKKVDMDLLCKDFYKAANNHNYNFIHCEVTGIDRKNKIVQMTKGKISYDYLVLAPGIAYDYKKQFPQYSDEMIHRLSQEAPAALISGSEHLALKRQLLDMEDGNVIITIPKGKYRCYTSPFERATMIANFMRKEGINGRVYLLDASKESKEIADTYLLAFQVLYRDRIRYYNDAEIKDVDLENKTVTIHSDKLSYSILNLIPPNKAHPLIKMAGLSTNEWGAAIMYGAGFRAQDDESIYVVGDAAGHDLPASAQMANWAGKRAGEQLGKRILGETVNEIAGLPNKNAGICYSMLCGKPDVAMMESYDIDFNGKCLVSSKERIFKEKENVYHSEKLANGMYKWFENLMKDTFEV